MSLGRIRALVWVLGPRRTFVHCASRPAKPDDYTLHPPDAKHSVTARAISSDLDVYYQIYIEKEYASIDLPAEPKLIFDCGANVGYSSAYFLTKFPDATLHAVEPDSGNFNVLQRNLEPYGQRAIAYQAAVWSDSSSVAISQSEYRDGRDWAKQVRAAESNDSETVQGISLDKLLTASGFTQIDILKMDIEGAEAIVFAENYESWLQKTNCIIIELHDDTDFGHASSVFHNAIKGQNFDITNTGELTVCIRRS